MVLLDPKWGDVRRFLWAEGIPVSDQPWAIIPVVALVRHADLMVKRVAGGLGLYALLCADAVVGRVWRGRGACPKILALMIIRIAEELKSNGGRIRGVYAR